MTFRILYLQIQYDLFGVSDVCSMTFTSLELEFQNMCVEFQCSFMLVSNYFILSFNRLSTTAVWDNKFKSKVVSILEGENSEMNEIRAAKVCG